jgi:nucleotide-binding universal stress UspA family protein
VNQEAQKVGIYPARILLAIDGSGEAELATRRAVDLANTTGSELHLVFVGQLPNFLMKVKDPNVVIFDRLGIDRMLYDEIEQESLQILWRLSWQVKLSGGGVAGAHLRMGNVAEQIMALAEDLQADLIVMGSRGHGGVRRAIEGSISDVVVRRARCAVMTVRSEESEKHRRLWRRVFYSGAVRSD